MFKLNLTKELKNIKKNRAILSLSVVFLVVLILYFERSLFLVAIVNGEPITRYSEIKELEGKGGKQVLDSLIEKALIYQEAKRSNIKISDQVVNFEVKKIEDTLKSQNTNLDDALKARGETRKSLVEQVRIQKILEAILGPKIKISDEEVQAYFKDNRAFFDKNAKYEDVKDQIKRQLFQQKLNDVYKGWIEGVRGKAKIIYFVNF